MEEMSMQDKRVAAARRWSAIALAVTTLVGVTALQAPAPVAAETIFVDYTKTTVGPRGPITVLGDSVMLGDLLEVEGYGPSVAQMLVERGWGPVRAKAGVGFQAGLFVKNNPGADMSRWVRERYDRGEETPIYIVSIGPNDIVACSGSQSCAEKDILMLVDAIGPDKEIWWSLITMKDPGDAAAWNNALAAVAARHPNLRLWDWPTAAAQNGIAIAKDGFHLPTGAAYVRRSRLMADDITARFGVSVQTGASESATAALGSPSEYQPLPLDRVYDSRPLSAKPPTTEIDLSMKVPAGTSAVSVNITAVAGPDPGFVTAYPCGAQRPVTSNVNFGAGQIRPNHVVVGLGAGAKLCVYESALADVIVDLQGAFVPSGGLRLDTQSPVRLVDTRNTGRADPLVVPVAAGAKGAVLNVTAVNAIAAGFLVVYPCDQPVPATSNLNFVGGDAVAGSVFAQLAVDGSVCVHANVPVDVIVDLQGMFTTGGALRFQAATPKRVLDTRVATGGWRGQVGVGQTIEFGVAPADARAVTGNITLVQPGLSGFATAYPCGGAAPATSSVNAATRTIAANSLTIGARASLCVRTSVGGHVLFDTTGWWVP
jgi:hypothetical protein